MLFQDFYTYLAQDEDLVHWLQELPRLLDQWQHNQPIEEYRRLTRLVAHLPQLQADEIDIKTQVSFSSSEGSSESEQRQITKILKNFKPWRKGPYHVHGVHIDTEWRSDFKWDRLLPHISPLKGRKVMDIGCGSGYHLWRMRGEGADYVLGVDPSLLFLSQFNAIKHFNPDPKVQFIPLGGEVLPKSEAFDTLFCMGVLYHRRSPIDFLEQLKAQLKPGGELVLETLVIEGDEQAVLVPTDRYAQMSNVWFIPSAAALKLWMEKLGYKNVRIVDTTSTTLEEQRKTDWMDSQSLDRFLDPDDANKTIEGYPAPLRAIIIAET